MRESTFDKAFLVVWIAAVLTSVTVLAVLMWAVVQLVQWVTA